MAHSSLHRCILSVSMASQFESSDDQSARHMKQCPNKCIENQFHIRKPILHNINADFRLDSAAFLSITWNTGSHQLDTLTQASSVDVSIKHQNSSKREIKHYEYEFLTEPNRKRFISLLNDWRKKPFQVWTKLKTCLMRRLFNLHVITEHLWKRFKWFRCST